MEKERKTNEINLNKSETICKLLVIISASIIVAINLIFLTWIIILINNKITFNSTEIFLRKFAPSAKWFIFGFLISSIIMSTLVILFMNIKKINLYLPALYLAIFLGIASTIRAFVSEYYGILIYLPIGLLILIPSGFLYYKKIQLSKKNKKVIQ